jgi:hypothetical protein
MHITLAIIIGVTAAVYGIRAIDATLHILSVRREAHRFAALRADAHRFAAPRADAHRFAAPRADACIWCDSTEAGHDWAKCEW